MRSMVSAALLVGSALGEGMSGAIECASSVEPWGRYSASGMLVEVDGERYIYSVGGDTRSVADDNGGGVVRTNFRYKIGGCWERLPDSPTALGFRGTAVFLNSSLWVFGGGDADRQATNHAFRLSIPDHEWTEITVATTGPTPRYKHAAVRLSASSALIVGGRTFGDDVESDAWIWDGTSWTLVSSNLLGEGIYRHGMTLVEEDDALWIFGGIDETLQRHDRLWKVNVETWEAVRVESTLTPNRRASHALEYVAELRSLVAYGGTCSDDSTLWIFDLSTEAWCTIDASRPPSLRDAFLWSLVGTTLHVVGGDVICVEPGQVYSIADVHSIDLSPATVQNIPEWILEYEPRNQRDESLEELCDGTNRGNCRAPTNLDDPPDPLNTCLLDMTHRDAPANETSSSQVVSSKLAFETTLATFLVLLFSM